MPPADNLQADELWRDAPNETHASIRCVMHSHSADEAVGLCKPYQTCRQTSLAMLCLASQLQAKGCEAHAQQAMSLVGLCEIWTKLAGKQT